MSPVVNDVHIRVISPSIHSVVVSLTGKLKTLKPGGIIQPEVLLQCIKRGENHSKILTLLHGLLWCRTSLLRWRRSAGARCGCTCCR